MSSVNNTGGPTGTGNWVATPEASAEKAGSANPILSELMSDTVAESDAMKQSTEKLAGKGITNPDTPLLSSDEEQAGTSAEQVKELQKELNSGSNEAVEQMLSGLPMDIQKAIYSGQSSPELEELVGQLVATGQIGTLGQLGLQSVPTAPPVDFKDMIETTGFPAPGPITTEQSPTVQQAQAFSNAVQTTGNGARILNAQVQATAGGSPEAQSLSAFLAAISDAITQLKEFLGSMVKSDMKGSMGQAVDAGSDRAQVAKAKMDEAKEASSSSGGGMFGDLLSPITDILGSIPIIGPMIQSLFGGAGGFGDIGGMFKGLLDMDIPLVGDMLKSIADMTSGIPLVGDLTKMISEHQGLFLIAVIAMVAVAALTICLGPVGIALGMAAFGAVMLGGSMLSGDKLPIVGDLLGGGGSSGGSGGASSKESEGGDDGMLGGLIGGKGSGMDMLSKLFGGLTGGSGGEGGMLDGLTGGGEGDSGGMLGGLIGGKGSGMDMLSKLFGGIMGGGSEGGGIMGGGGGGGSGGGGMLDGIGGMIGMKDGQLPIVGGMLKGITDMMGQIPIIGDLTKMLGMDNQLVFLVDMAAIAMMVLAFPIGLLIGPLTIAGMALLSGGGGDIPIIGDLMGGGGDMLGGLFGGGGGGSSRAATPSSQQGAASAVSNAYGTTAMKVAKDHDAAESDAELIAQIQKMLSLLLQVQAQAASGGAPSIPTDQITELASQLSEQGIGGVDMQQAVDAGKAGDNQAMIDALNRAFTNTGDADPATLAALSSFGMQGIQTQGTPPTTQGGNSFMTQLAA